MGKEAVTTVRWGGASGEAKLLLEADHLAWRGALRGKILRTDIAAFRAEGDELVIEAPAGELRAALGAKAAQSWAKALGKPPPSLADKLGIGPAALCFVVGAFDDAALEGALAEAWADAPEAAALGMAVFGDPALVDQIPGFPVLFGGRPVWCVYPKGGKEHSLDRVLRAAMREAGYQDTKACAVSERLTATRYTRKRT